MARPDLRGRRAWRVRIAAHRVAHPGGLRSHEVPASERLRFEAGRGEAVAAAIRAAHIEAEVPAWRPYLRQSVSHATVEETWWTPEGG